MDQKTKTPLAVERNIPEEIRESYREDLRLMRQNKEHRTRRHTIFNNGPEGVSIRGRRWSQEEIRKEYGIMNCPYPTMAENIIAIIMDSSSPITLNQIAEMVGKKPKNVSSHLSHVFHAFDCLGDECQDVLIVREMLSSPGGGQFAYSFKSNNGERPDMIQMKELYLKGMQIRRENEKIKKKDEALTKEMELMEKTADEMDVATDEKGAAMLEALFRSGIDVRVTVEFKFPR